MKAMKKFCGAAALAGAIAAVTHMPAEVQAANAIQLAASASKADSAVVQKVARQIKSTPPSKRRRCPG